MTTQKGTNYKYIWKYTNYNIKIYSLVHTTQKKKLKKYNVKTTKYIVTCNSSIPLISFTIPIAQVAIYPAKLWTRF
jgi:hypothetical protein